MALDNREVVLKLVVDGKEAIVNLELTNQQLDKLKSTVEKFTPNASRELNNINISGKDASKGLQSMNMAMGQLGYVLNDAQVLLVNFRMGLMGISNNLPFIVSLFRQAQEDIKGTETTIGSLVMNALKGPGGLMIAINGVMLLLNLLPSLFRDTTEEIKNQTFELEKLSNEYSKLTQRQLNLKKAEVEQQIFELTKEFQQKYGERGEFLKAVPLVGGIFESFGELSEEEQNRYTALQNQLRAIEKANAKLGYTKNLENELNLIYEKRNQIKSKEQLEAFDKAMLPTIAYYRRLIEQSRIDKYFEKKSTKEAPQLPEIPIEDVDLKFLADELPDVKFATEEELQRLKINNITNEWEKKKALADWEYQMQLKKYEDYENFEQIKTELDKNHAIIRQQIAEEEAQAKLNTLSQNIQMMRGLFGEHTAAYKALTIFQTIIDTYQAATAAYKSTAEIPIIGPVLAPISAAAATAFGLGQVANIEKAQIPAYAKGGFGIVGEKGVEIIAPLQDYAQGQAELVNRTIKFLDYKLSTGSLNLTGTNNFREFADKVTKAFDEIRSWQREINFRIRGEDLITASDRVYERREEFEF